MALVRVKETNEILVFAPGSMVAVQRPGSNEDFEISIKDIEIIPDEDRDIDRYTRNHFAALAMSTLLEHGNNSDEWVARRAFEVADAMMKQMNINKKKLL